MRNCSGCVLNFPSLLEACPPVLVFGNDFRSRSMEISYKLREGFPAHGHGPLLYFSFKFSAMRGVLHFLSLVWASNPSCVVLFALVIFCVTAFSVTIIFGQKLSLHEAQTVPSLCNGFWYTWHTLRFSSLVDTPCKCRVHPAFAYNSQKGEFWHTSMNCDCCLCKRLLHLRLMMYGEIIAARSKIHTKHTNTLCGQNVDFFLG